MVAAIAGCAGTRNVEPATDPIDATLDEVVQSAADMPIEVAKAAVPSNDRDWIPLQARLATAEFHGHQVTIHNVRNTEYRTADDYTVRYEDRTYDLDDLKTLDFIVVPFPEAPDLAHTMLSFGFDNEDFLAVSVETRKEKGEGYEPLSGVLNQYEIIYVLGDERDLIKLRTHCWMNDVYLYRTRATPEQTRAIFKDVLTRVNNLAVRPEFYNTLTNNCTTAIRGHINKLFPDRIPYDYRVLLPGHSDKLAYELDLLDTDTTYERTRERARINYLAYLYGDDPDFSVKIRRGIRSARPSPALARNPSSGHAHAPSARTSKQ